MYLGAVKIMDAGGNGRRDGRREGERRRVRHSDVRTPSEGPRGAAVHRDVTAGFAAAVVSDVPHADILKPAGRRCQNSGAEPNPLKRELLQECTVPPARERGDGSCSAGGSLPARLHSSPMSGAQLET